MDQTASIVEQVRAIAEKLSATERLAIIHAIVTAEPLPAESHTAEQFDDTHHLISEEDAWYSRPKAERMVFAGNYVAVQDGVVVDHDSDQGALVLRTRSRPGPVLIVPAEWDAPPTYSFPSTYLSS